MEQERLDEAPAATRWRCGVVRRLQVAALLTLLGCMSLQSTHSAPLRLEPQLAPSDSAGLYAAQRGNGYVANLGDVGEVSLWRWDADRKRLVRVLTLRDAATTVRLTNDGEAEEPLLAVGTHYGEIKLYDTAGRLLCRSQVPQGAEVVQIEASRAQDVVVAADAQGAVHLWDARCKERKLNAYKHDQLVTSLAVHKNIAITASLDGTLGAIALMGAEPLPRIQFSDEGLNGIGALALAEDGSRLALRISGDLHLFETEQLEQMFRSEHKPKLLRTLEEWVETVAMLRPGDRLLYQDMSARLMLWDLRTGETRQLRPAGSVSQFAVAADGTTVYVASSNAQALQVFRLGFTQAAPPVRLSTEAISGVAIAQDRIVAATSTGIIRFVDGEGIVELGGGDTGKSVYTFAMSRDGSAIALARSDIEIEVLDAKTLKAKSYYYGRPVLKRATDTLLGKMQTAALDFLPDGKSFAAASTFGIVSLWDRGKTDPVQESMADSSTQLRLSPDGQRVAVIAGNFLENRYDEKIIVANFKDRKDRIEIHQPHGRNLVSSIAFSAKGDQLVTVGSDAKVWDAKGGKMIEQFAMDDPVGIYKAEFIEGDQALLLFMADGSVVVLDRKAGAPPKLRYRSDTNAWAAGRLEAKAAAVSPDGSVAVVGTGNGSVLVWRQGLQLLAEVRSSSISLVTMTTGSVYLICGYSNFVPMCWDLQRGLLPVPAQAEKGSVKSIAASPSGGAIAAIRQAGYVTVWPADSPNKAMTVPTNGISGWLRWSLDGSTIYLVGDDYGTDVVTRLAVDRAGASAKAMPPWKAPGRISGLFPLEGGGIAVMVSREIHVLDPSLRETERIIVPESCREPLWSQPVSFLSRDLLAYSCDGGVLVMKREASGWRQVMAEETFSEPSAFGFDPKQNLLVSGHTKGDLNVWDLQAGKLEARLSVGQPIQAVGMRDGMLVAGTADGQLLFYRLSDQVELGRAILDAEGAMVVSANGWYGISGRPALQLAGIESSKESASESLSSRNSMATVNAMLLERDRWTVRAREVLARQAALARARFVSLSFLEQLGVTAAVLYSSLVFVMAAAWFFTPAKLFVWSLKLSSSWTANSMNRLQGST